MPPHHDQPFVNALYMKSHTLGSGNAAPQPESQKNVKASLNQPQSTLRISLISIDQSRASEFTLRNPNIQYHDKHGIRGSAIPAQDYFYTSVLNRERPLTPAETGCALSHLSALESFIDSDSDFLCVFEDDIAISETFPVEIMDTLRVNIKKPCLVHLGGLDGLSARRRLMGKKTIGGVWLIPPLATRWLWRAGGYIINKKMAELIAKRQRTDLSLADNWAVLTRQADAVVFYSPIINHPIILEGSSLESDRRLVEATLKRSDLIIRKINGALITIFLFTLGYRHIH